MTEIRFTVEGSPPSQNRAYRIVTIAGHGSLAKTAEAKRWQSAVAHAAAQAAEERLAGPLRVEFIAYFDSRRPDVDGFLKLTLDGLQGWRDKSIGGCYGGCIVNDRQVVELVVRKAVDKARPRLEVRVVALTEGD